MADWDSINDLLAAWGCPTRVRAQGPVSGRWFLDRTGPPQVHLRLEAGPEARLCVGEAFTQPQATAVVADLAGLIDAEGDALRDLTVDLAVGTGRLTIDRGELRHQAGDSSGGPPTTVLRGQFEAQAMESLAACLPPLRRWGVNAAGSLSGELELQFRPGCTQGQLTASMQPATITAGRLLAKAPGQQADLEVHFTRDEHLAPQERSRLTAHGALEGSDVSTTVTWTDGDSSAGRVAIEVQVRDADGAVENLPLLADVLAGGRLSGQADVVGLARWEGPTLEGQLRCDANRIEYVSAGLPRRVKTARTPLAMELAGRVTRRGEGDFDFVADHAGVTSRDHWAHLRGSGTIRGLQEAAGDQGDLRCASAELDLTELRGTVGGKAVAAGGAVTLEDVRWPAGGKVTIGRVTTDGLELRRGQPRVGPGRSAQPARESHRPIPRPGGVPGRQRPGGLAGHGGPDGPRGGPRQVERTGADRDALLAQADQRILAARDALAGLALQGRIGIDRYRTYDAESDRSYLARSLEAQLSIEDARVSAVLDAAVKGGIVSRRYDLDLTGTAPRLAVYSEVRELMADESIQPQLNWYFPGNTFYGLFSRTEEVSFALRQLVAHGMDPSAPVWPVGHAKTVATDGMLQGRAAPYFVASIFPGLNLTRYRYNRMTAFAEYRPDGLAVNDMVFSGQTYDIYIEGTTAPDRIGRYEIGLILLGSPQSAEWNHTYRQGRIPLLNVKARIEGGQMRDESVTYPYPTQSLFTIFLKNNIFYRLWLASKR